MNKIAQKLKNIIKKPSEPTSYGKNPMDPWSARADINEGSLDQYLKAKGINPEFVSKDMKISHAKSLAFQKWKKEHQTEEVIPEMITTEPGLTHKKKAETQKSVHAHKEIKTPRGPGSHNEAKGSQMTQLTPESVSSEIHGEAKTTQGTALDKFRQAAAERAKKHAEIEKKQSKDGSGMTSAIDRLQKHLNKEDVGDPKAAVNADGLPNPQLEPVSEKKKQMSKSARMIKALYKKKGVVKEDIYDHEKEDKSVATYGKKPKMEKADKDESIGEKKPQAALTLTGGKTLTGTERDTVEIDPMMRNRPGQPDVTKKDDKKDDKKKDEKKR
jgi:hypothetical protein